MADPAPATATSAGAGDVGVVGVSGGLDVDEEDEAEIVELMRQAERDGGQLTFEALARLRGGRIAALEKVENVLAKRNKRLVEEGTLVASAEVERRFSERVGAAARRLSNLPGRVSQRLMLELDIPGSDHGTVERLIQEETDRVMAEMGGEEGTKGPRDQGTKGGNGP